MERGFKLGLLWRAAPVVARAGVLRPASLSGFWKKGRWVLAQGKGEVPVVVARKLESSIGVAPNDPGHDHLLQCASHCQLFHCGSFSCVNRLRTSWCVAPKVELLQLIQPCGELLSAVGGR